MLANGFVCEDEDINGWLQATELWKQKDKQPLLNIKEGIKAYAKEAEYIWRDMSPSIIKDHNKYVEIATKQLQEAIGGAVNSKRRFTFYNLNTKTTAKYAQHRLPFVKTANVTKFSTGCPTRT